MLAHSAPAAFYNFQEIDTLDAYLANWFLLQSFRLVYILFNEINLEPFPTYRAFTTHNFS